ncbi:MAG: hypothetical protein Q9O62_03780 [Ardenticatenia bacterium]|nr:hypothetical protein [Ardenticatenia bacterium]
MLGGAWPSVAGVVGLALFHAVLVAFRSPATFQESQFLVPFTQEAAGELPFGLYSRLVGGGVASLWTDPADQLKALRLLSTLFAVSTLLVLFITARGAFPRRRTLHIGAPLLLAATPSFTLASGQAGPKAFVALLAALLIWLSLWTVQRGLTLFSFGGIVALLLAGWQVDWGFWWLTWPVLLVVPAALWRHRDDDVLLIGQIGVLIGTGIALAGGIMVLGESGHLLPWLSKLVRETEAIVARSVWPTTDSLTVLFFRYWADFTDPGHLWWGSVSLWTLISFAGLSVVLWQEHSAELIVPLAAVIVLGAGALVVPDSVTSWPAPAWPAAALLLAAGWPHLVPRRARPLWLLVGLLVVELLNLAALVG